MTVFLRKHRNDWDTLTSEIIGAAIEVHRELGPGLLESAYEECLAEELSLRRIEYARQVAIPVVYRGRILECGYRVDFIVGPVAVELKAVEHLLPVHRAQLLTYLRLKRLRCGLLLNFNVSTFREGIIRLLAPDPSAPPLLRGSQ
jgi:GxxExxY protein